MSWLYKIAQTGVPFFGDCVDWPQRLLPALEYLIANGDEISREEFLSSVDFEGNPDEMIPEWDHYIRYYKLGDIYWFDHSAIEHVFAFPHQIKALNNKALNED